MKEQHLEVQKTARFYTLGELNAKTKKVWFVLHGFGQNAKSFLSQFEPLQNEDVFFIAPEGLNRFYLKGSYGEVGATWMTKEDRLNEIKDYIHYLDDLYGHFELERFSGEITALGFSQGAATVTRWISATQNKIDTLVVFAGEVAPELFPLQKNSPLLRTKNVFICGTEDEYFKPEMVAQMKATYKEMKFVEIDFNGTHEIRTDLLAPFLK